MRSITLIAAAGLHLGSHAQLSSGCFTIGGSGNDVARALVQTNDGGYAFTGSSFLMVKTDANGAVEWNASYPNSIDPNGSGATDLIQTSDGGYALVGTSTSITMGLVKLDAAGTVEWSKEYDTGVNGVDDLLAVLQTPDGGYLLTGDGDDKVLLIKTDDVGQIEWSKHYQYNFAGSIAYDVVAAFDGGYALCEWTQVAVGYHVMRLAENGDVLWAKSYGVGTEQAFAMAATPDSGFVVVGGTRNYGFADAGDLQYDALVVKLDLDGELEWAHTFGDTLSEIFHGVVPTADGGYAMAGSVSTPPEGSGAPHIYVAKCDADGELLWSQRMGPVTPSLAWDIIECNDDGLAITGVVNVAFDLQFGFMKMEADGTICPACGSEPYGRDSAAVIVPVDLTYDVFDNVATSSDYIVTTNPGGTASVGCSGTGMAESNAMMDGLTVAPNPVTDRCIVSLGNAIVEGLELIGPQGTLIMYTPVNGRRQVAIPVAQLAPGGYLLRTIGMERPEAVRLMIMDR